LFEVLGQIGHDPSKAPFVSINLSWNKIKDVGVKAISTFLKQTQCLTALDLSGNDIGPVGGEAIAEALSLQTSLVSINLHGNPLGKVAGFRIMTAMATNETVKTLNMGNTELDQRAICALAIALRSNNTLTDINIDKPLLFSLMEETTIHIAQALTENSTLSSLSLAKHGIQTHGCEWLARALRDNRTLTKLDLSGNNGIGASAAAAIAAALVDRPLSCLVELNYCPLRGQDVSEIQQALQKPEDNGEGGNQVTFHSDYMSHRLVSETKRPPSEQKRSGSGSSSRQSRRQGEAQRPASRQSTATGSVGAPARVRFGDDMDEEYF
jgi:Ran GTPase-activating protein (RanGAP) involved in mRNA processing and transport